MEENIKKIKKLKKLLNGEAKEEFGEPLEKLLKEYDQRGEIIESFIWQTNFDMKILEEDYIEKSKIKQILDKAEVMDYYTLSNVIEDLENLLK